MIIRRLLVVFWVFVTGYDIGRGHLIAGLIDVVLTVAVLLVLRPRRRVHVITSLRKRHRV
jgi:hypothetical protein